MHDDAHYSLIDPSDPTVGVSIKYRAGDTCRKNNAQRQATIDVYCEDTTPAYVHHAEEPDHCQYHVIVKSTKGCPTVRACVRVFLNLKREREREIGLAHVFMRDVCRSAR